MSIRHEVIVVGGGQAGLAAGYFLARRGLDFTILEAAEAAASWRQRWDSLRLFTPARYSSLPGLSFPGDPDGYPGRDEVVDYLSHYAAHMALPVEQGSRVHSLRRERGGFVLDAGDRSYEADQVVIATGPFQTPRVPPFAEGLSDEATQLHSSSYRSPDSIPSGRVLVVGGGNSGFQIAEDLSGSHEVHLAVGSRQMPLPQRVLGRDLFWYLEKTGLMTVSRQTRLGRRMAGREFLIGSSPRRLRRRQAVMLHPRAVHAEGTAIRFADGSAVVANAVIWATGFHPDLAWVDLPVLDGEGRPIHRRGLTSEPGLYFLGLTWQHTRGSALLGWVKDDAEYLARQIDAFQAARSTGTPQRHMA